MSDQFVIAGMTFILDRGMGNIAVTSYFTKKSHDDLVNEFCNYLEAHRALIPSHLEITQALNDRGTDLILKDANCKLGFQIKSHYDVSERNFVANVKRQQTESLAHGLDKWYLLICSPLQYENQDYSERIQFLLNEISSYKTKYVECYGPRNTIKFFNNPSFLTVNEFEEKMKSLPSAGIDLRKSKERRYKELILKRDKLRKFISEDLKDLGAIAVGGVRQGIKVQEFPFLMQDLDRLIRSVEIAKVTFISDNEILEVVNDILEIARLSWDTQVGDKDVVRFAQCRLSLKKILLSIESEISSL